MIIRRTILLLVFGAACIVFLVSPERREYVRAFFEPTPTPAEIESSTIGRVNYRRSADGLRLLSPSPDLNALLPAFFQSAQDSQTIAAIGASGIMEALPAAASVSVDVLEAVSLTDLDKNLLPKRKIGQSSDLTHIGVYSYKPSHPGRRIGVAVVTARLLPEFAPALLRKVGSTYFSTCSHCERTHTGQVDRPRGGVVSLACPYCHKKYDIFAMGLDGNYRQVGDLLTDFNPPSSFAESMSSYDEVTAIWRAAKAHCRYVHDLTSTSGEDGSRDSWQTARETYRYRNGDCEDSSILLATWLISRGYDARVVVGELNYIEPGGPTTGQRGGHAWCVVAIAGKEYILESTSGNQNAVDDQVPLPVHQGVDKYFPIFQFDRARIYLPRSEAEIFSYWDETLWTTHQPEKREKRRVRESASTGVAHLQAHVFE